MLSLPSKPGGADEKSSQGHESHDQERLFEASCGLAASVKGFVGQHSLKIDLSSLASLVDQELCIFANDSKHRQHS